MPVEGRQIFRRSSRHAGKMPALRFNPARLGSGIASTV
jgi:hypothetical protein